MIRIAITGEACAAIESTMLLGSVAVEPQPDDKGEQLIWLEPHVANKPRLPRGLGESNVTLKLAGET